MSAFKCLKLSLWRKVVLISFGIFTLIANEVYWISDTIRKLMLTLIANEVQWIHKIFWWNYCSRQRLQPMSNFVRQFKLTELETLKYYYAKVLKFLKFVFHIYRVQNIVSNICIYFFIDNWWRHPYTYF